MIVEFSIDGAPTGKERPRVCRFGTYTPKKTVDYEKKVKKAFSEQTDKCFDSAINVSIRANYDIPKSYSKKRRKLIEDRLELPTKKPDCDNIAKIILDALNGLAYKDDSQVVVLRVYKRYVVGDASVDVTMQDEI